MRRKGGARPASSREDGAHPGGPGPHVPTAPPCGFGLFPPALNLEVIPKVDLLGTSRTRGKERCLCWGGGRLRGEKAGRAGLWGRRGGGVVRGEGRGPGKYSKWLSSQQTGWPFSESPLLTAPFLPVCSTPSPTCSLTPPHPHLLLRSPHPAASCSWSGWGSREASPASGPAPALPLSLPWAGLTCGRAWV